MGVFGNKSLNAVTVSTRQPRFTPVRIVAEGAKPTYAKARYVVEIDSLRKIDTNKGPMVLLETRVLESNNPELASGPANWAQATGAVMAMQNVKQLLIAAAGLDAGASRDSEAIAKEDWDKAEAAAFEPEKIDPKTKAVVGNALKGLKLVVTSEYRLKKNRQPNPAIADIAKDTGSQQSNWFNMISFLPFKAEN